MDKNNLLYRVFKEEGKALGLDMDEFYRKRRRGLIPFKNPQGEIEWLKRKEFRIAAAKKREGSEGYKKAKKHHHHSHSSKKEDDIDLTNIFPKREIKFVFIGIGSLIVVYLILKLVEMIVM